MENNAPPAFALGLGAPRLWVPAELVVATDLPPAPDPDPPDCVENNDGCIPFQAILFADRDRGVVSEIRSVPLLEAFSEPKRTGLD